MTEQNPFKEAPLFKSPEEELEFLRKSVKEKEQQIQESSPERSREVATKETIREYAKIPISEVLPKERMVTEGEAEGITLNLRPEAHDSQIEEFLGILLQKGVKNTLSILERMNNPHLDDDFHRFLVQYINASGDVPGLKEKTPLFKALKMTLLEITLPAPLEPVGFKEFIGAMEQFYAGMQSVTAEDRSYTQNNYALEIAISNEGEQVIIYAAVPSDKKDMLEKHLNAFYNQASIREVSDDYNIFNDEGGSAGAYAELKEHPALPIKTYDEFDHDPINSILHVFSKLAGKGEGASIQLVVSPAGDRYIKSFSSVLKDVKEGKKLEKESRVFSAFDKELAQATRDLIFGIQPQKDEGKDKKINETFVEKISQKTKSTIVATNIRILASAETRERAQTIVNELESAFNQFSDSNANSIIFKKVPDNKLRELFHSYSYRLPDKTAILPLNLRELSTIFHFPVGVSGTPQLKEARANIAPAPLELAKEGTLLGVNSYRGKETPVFFDNEDRMRHFYVIGQTGTGKTTILKNMIIQDIKNGDGVCFIDPHGSDVQDILAHIPKERVKDVIYFDPAYTARPMGLNMLEYDPRFPEQKTFVVNELLSIFNKLFDMKTAGGPMFEQYFRNSALLVMEDPDSGNTLLEIGRVLSDKAFRDMKLSKSKNPIINQFWINAEQTTGDQALSNFVPYITSKFDVFITNEIMRPVIAQEKSAFNFRDVMDNKKILLVNLSKGRLGEINANLIGLILVGKILMAALSRVDAPQEERNDFYLYIDEFQNVTTDSISQILSEARKYRLSLNVAHQFIGQLTEEIKNSVFGNVGSMAIFRVGSDDATYLENQFTPTFKATDIMKLENFNAYMKLLVHGQPVKPFNLTILPPEPGNKDIVDPLKQLSYLEYGQDREIVERDIMRRYKAL